MSLLKTISGLDETPIRLFTELSSIHSFLVSNPSATTVAYLKLYLTEDAPTVATDTPSFEIPIPTAAAATQMGIVSIPDLDVELTSCWIAAGSVSGADATAPDEDLHITMSYTKIQRQ